MCNRLRHNTGVWRMDRRTVRQTSYHGIVHATHMRRAVKKQQWSKTSISLKAINPPFYPTLYIVFSKAQCVNVNEDWPALSAAKQSQQCTVTCINLHGSPRDKDYLTLKVHICTSECIIIQNYTPPLLHVCNWLQMSLCWREWVSV